MNRLAVSVTMPMYSWLQNAQTTHDHDRLYTKLPPTPMRSFVDTWTANTIEDIININVFTQLSSEEETTG